MKSILVTGFAPFGGEIINPSYEAVKLLPDEILNYKIVKKEIQTAFNLSKDELIETIQKEQPVAVLLMGQAGGAKNMRIERVAINLDDASIADNLNVSPVDQPIIDNGPSAYFSTLPIKKIVENLRDDGIPAVVSNSAGTYVCNHLMYHLLYYLDQEKINIPGGFIHVPYIFDQIKDKPDTYATDLYQITKTIDIAIKTIIKECLWKNIL